MDSFYVVSWSVQSQNIGEYLFGHINLGQHVPVDSFYSVSGSVQPQNIGENVKKYSSFSLALNLPYLTFIYFILTDWLKNLAISMYLHSYQVILNFRVSSSSIALHYENINILCLGFFFI